MPKKKNSEIREKINKIYEENELANLVSNKNRARSVTVGTAFGGSVELSMRGDYSNLWAILQPVEVVEIIEQLASGVGLQIAIRPRQDFATWRGWDVNAEDRYWVGVGSWQIEQASISHKKMLEEQKEQLKLISPRNKRGRSSSKNTKDQKRIKTELKIQQELHDTLEKESQEIHKKFQQKLDDDFEQMRKDIDYEENV